MGKQGILLKIVGGGEYKFTTSNSLCSMADGQAYATQAEGTV